MKFLAFVMSLSASASFAGTVDEINYLLEDIGYTVNNTQQDTRTLLRTQKRLEKVYESLDANAPGTTPVPPTPTPIPEPEPTPARATFCDTNGNILIDLSTGATIFDFSNLQDCQEAKENLAYDKGFCDTNDNKLYTPELQMIHDFSNTPDCKGALERVYQGKNFCDYNDNTLRRVDGSLIYDFGNNTDCTNSLE